MERQQQTEKHSGCCGSLTRKERMRVQTESQEDRYRVRTPPEAKDYFFLNVKVSWNGKGFLEPDQSAVCFGERGRSMY